MALRSGCVVFFACALALPAQPVSLSVSQTWTDASTVTAYLYPRGADGLPAEAASPQVTASVAGQDLNAASVTPFGGGIAYIMLADISKSMLPEQYNELRKAMQGFAAGLTNRDRMSVISFGSDVQVVQDFTPDLPVLDKALAGLKPADNETKLYLAVSRALELAQRMDAAIPKRRAIVVLSDGKDEGSGLNVDDVLSAIRSARTPVYAIGSSRLKEPEKKQYLDLLRRIAANSGGEYFDAAASFAESYEKIRKSVAGVLIAQFDCGRCPRTGKPEQWTFSLKSGDKVLTASTEIAIAASVEAPGPTAAPPSPSPPPAPQPSNTLRRRAPFIGVGTIPVLLILLFAARHRRRKKRMLAEQEQMAAEAEAFVEPVPPPPPIPAVPVMETAPPAPSPPPPPPQLQGVSIKLFVMRGQQRNTVHELQLARPTTFGSGPSCGFSLPKERSLAAQQFELSYGNQRVLIRDLSGNATTTVNGIPIHGSHPLKDGDVIGAGGAEFRLLIGK